MNKSNIGIILLVVFGIVFANNFFINKDLKSSATLTFLNFDQSLIQYSDSQIGKGLNVLNVVIIISHVLIPILIFLMLLTLTRGFLKALIFTALIITALHLINYTFLDNNPFSWNALVSLLPLSGILHLFSIWSQIQHSVVNHITQNVTNISNNLTGIVADMT
jgi:hypothetical protein